MTPTGLKRIRRELGLTQARLAKEIGVDRVTVARWEMGARRITEPVARLIQRLRADGQAAGDRRRRARGRR